MLKVKCGNVGHLLSKRKHYIKKEDENSYDSKTTKRKIDERHKIIEEYIKDFLEG